MNSQAWQKQIDDTNADITAKEKRLAALAHAKAAVIAIPDTKKLLALEQEEAALPALIESLRRRVPLLNQALEGALQTEAEARHRELAKAGAEAATQGSESTARIRVAMQSVLDAITAAHADWQAHALLAAEAAYLSLRFSLTPSQISPGERLTPEEQHGFTREFTLRLRPALNTQPWDRMRTEWQEARRREESQRQAAADKARPSNPHYIHFTDSLVQRGNDHAPAVVPDTRSGTALAAQPGASLALVAEKEKTAASLRQAIMQEQ